MRSGMAPAQLGFAGALRCGRPSARRTVVGAIAWLVPLLRLRRPSAFRLATLVQQRPGGRQIRGELAVAAANRLDRRDRDRATSTDVLAGPAGLAFVAARPSGLDVHDRGLPR